MPFMGNEVGSNIPIIYRWDYANAAARTGATGFAATDVGKVARQTDTVPSTYWILDTPTPTWSQVADSGTLGVETTARLSGDAYLYDLIVTNLSGDLNVLDNLATPGLAYTLHTNTYSVAKGTAVTTGAIYIPRYYNGKPVTAIDSAAFYQTAITAVSIPDTVTTIGAGAFTGGSTLLTEVTIPASVTSIGDSAFAGIGTLVSAKMQGLTPPALGSAPFQSSAATFKFYVPYGYAAAYKAAATWIYQADVTKIHQYALDSDIIHDTGKPPFLADFGPLAMGIPVSGTVDVTIPLTTPSGTIDVARYDHTIQESQYGQFVLPPDLDPAGTLVVKARGIPGTPSSGAHVQLSTAVAGVSSGGSVFVTYHNLDSANTTITAVANNIDEIQMSGSVTSLGLSADQLLMFNFSRLSGNTGNLSGDYLITDVLFQAGRI